MKGKGFSVLGVLLLSVAASRCNSNSTTSPSTAATLVMNAPAATVGGTAAYAITGSAKSCVATYDTSSGGETQASVTIPFTYSWSGAVPGELLYMSCQINDAGDQGTVTVQLIENGTAVETSTATGFPGIAAVSGTF